MLHHSEDTLLATTLLSFFLLLPFFYYYSLVSTKLMNSVVKLRELYIYNFHAIQIS